VTLEETVVEEPRQTPPTKRVRIQRNTNANTNTNTAGATGSTASATITTAAGAINSTAAATTTGAASRVDDVRNTFETIASATTSTIGAITNAVTTRLTDEFHRITSSQRTYGRSPRLEASNNHVITTATAVTTATVTATTASTPTTSRPIDERQQLAPTKRVRVREKARQQEARTLLNSTIHPGESPYFDRNQRARIRESSRRHQGMDILNTTIRPTDESPLSESDEGARTRESSRTGDERNQPISPIHDSGDSRQPERSRRVRFQVTPPPLPPSPVNRNRASLRQRSRPGARKD